MVSISFLNRKELTRKSKIEMEFIEGYRCPELQNSRFSYQNPEHTHARVEITSKLDFYVEKCILD